MNCINLRVPPYYLSPKIKNYQGVHQRLADVETFIENYNEIDCGDWRGQFGGEYRVCCHKDDCWETILKEVNDG